MPKITIFSSGTGTNAAKIIEYFQKIDSTIEVDCIVTNRQEAGIYEVAKQFEVAIFRFENKKFESGETVLDFLKERKVEWIVLAGFLRKIPVMLIENFENRIINIHPSLLPKYGGKGMYGSHVHAAVIENKEAASGISIHLVNQEFDKGELLFQSSFEVENGETIASLSKKIQRLEHHHFPRVIENTIQSNEN